MRTFVDIIDAFGGPARFSEAIGIEAFHGQTMKTRGSIPPAYWNRVVMAARQKRISGITLESLAKIAEARGAA